MAIGRFGTAAPAWSLAAVAFLTTCAEVALLLASSAGLPLNAPDEAAWIDYPQRLLFPLVGVLIARARPANPVGWLLLGYGAGSGVVGMNAAYAELGITSVESLPGVGTAAWLATWAWMVPLLCVPLTLLHFPTGRLPGRSWRWARWLCAAPAVLVCAPAVAWYGKPAAQLHQVTTGALLGEDWIAPFITAMFASLIASVVAAFASLVVRYRNGGTQQRQQLKWLLLAVGVLAVQGIWENFLPGPEAVKAAVGAVTFAGVPVAIGIAILRHRLYDIDQLINRAVVYGALTAIIGAIYALTTLSASALGPRIPTAQSDLAVAATTLAVAGAFQPLRRRIQRAVDRRFYRSRYDAQQTVERFSAQLRDAVDVDLLASELLRVVGRALQPVQASLWTAPTAPRRPDRPGARPDPPRDR